MRWVLSPRMALTAEKKGNKPFNTCIQFGFHKLYHRKRGSNEVLTGNRAENCRRVVAVPTVAGEEFLTAAVSK